MKFQEFIKKLRNLSETKKIIIIFVVVAMVAPVMGYLWFRSASYHISKVGESVNSLDLPNIDLPNLDNMLPDAEQTQTIDSSVKNVSTADWKTYTNTEYGFEFKYPQDEETDNPSQDSLIVFNNVVFKIWDNLEKLKIEDYLKKACDLYWNKYHGKGISPTICQDSQDIYYNIEPLSIENINGFSIYFEDESISGGKNRFGFIILSPDESYVIDISYLKEDIFNKILSTFKFTN